MRPSGIEVAPRALRVKFSSRHSGVEDGRYQFYLFFLGERLFSAPAGAQGEKAMLQISPEEIRTLRIGETNAIFR